jgi:flagellar biogenesis protein FliO
VETLFLILRVAVSLGVVLAVIWWAHRRVTAGRARTRKTELVTVVARQAVAPKASVVVVDADGRRLTLGVTEHGVTVLHDREAPDVSETAPAPLRLLEPAPRTSEAFDAVLATATTQFPTRSAARAASASLATHGMRRGSIRSAETWKRSLAGVREGLGI